MRNVDPCGTIRSIFALGFAAASDTSIAPPAFSFLFNAGTHMDGVASGAGASRHPPDFCSSAAGRDSPEFVCAETIAGSIGKKKIEYTIRQGQGIMFP